MENDIYEGIAHSGNLFESILVTLLHHVPPVADQISPLFSLSLLSSAVNSDRPFIFHNSHSIRLHGRPRRERRKKKGKEKGAYWDYDSDIQRQETYLHRDRLQGGQLKQQPNFPTTWHHVLNWVWPICLKGSGHLALSVVQGARNLWGQRFCVLFLEICAPSLFSPSPLCGATLRTK